MHSSFTPFPPLCAHSLRKESTLFFTKLEARVFRPAFASLSPEKVDRPLAAAFKQVDEAIVHILARAKLGKVA
ncbi:MAG: hypothetical protein AB1556_16355 [Bacillota bacterium]